MHRSSLNFPGTLFANCLQILKSKWFGEKTVGRKTLYNQSKKVVENKKGLIRLPNQSLYKLFKISDSARIQTLNLLIRSQVLYSVELQSQLNKDLNKRASDL